MPARVAAIRAAIESRQDFTGLANGGEDAVARWARTRGLNGRALILEWQQAYRQRQAQVERGHKKPLDQESGPGVSKRDVAAMHDLDYWSDSEPEPDDDGDGGDDAETVPCQVCNGAGKDVTGRVCAACGGTGVAPDDDKPDDDDETEGRSYGYEFKED